MSLIKANTPLECARETGQAEAEAWLKKKDEQKRGLKRGA
jgi:hypothetical protein